MYMYIYIYIYMYMYIYIYPDSPLYPRRQGCYKIYTYLLGVTVFLLYHPPKAMETALFCNAVAMKAGLLQ